MRLKNILFGKENKNTDGGTERLVPVSGISGGVIALKNGKFVTVIEVLPLNFYLKSELEQKNIISGFAAFLKVAPDELQITVKTRPADISRFCDRLEEYYNSEKNENCRRMIFEDAQLVNFIAETEALSRRFYIVLPYTGRQTDLSSVINEMNETVLTARQYLEACGLETVRHNDGDAFSKEVLRKYFRPFSAETENSGAELCELLTPDAADLTNSGYICIEGEYRSYLYISGGGYPTTAGLAWGSPFAEAGDGITVSFALKRISREKILPKIGNTAMLNRSRLRQARIIRTRFLSVDFPHCRVKILVNPLGLTAFCALHCKKIRYSKNLRPKTSVFLCGFLCEGYSKAVALQRRQVKIRRKSAVLGGLGLFLLA